jgi:hypothetical protein
VLPVPRAPAEIEALRRSAEAIRGVAQAAAQVR